MCKVKISKISQNMTRNYLLFFSYTETAWVAAKHAMEVVLN